MQPIDSILAVAKRYDTIVFDQWGVLHNGTSAYPQAIETITALKALNVSMAVLSNSGKAAELNRERITGMGFDPAAFGTVMTSGEALWRDIESGALQEISTLFAITAAPGDAERWAAGLDIRFTQQIDAADALLLMGLPDGQDHTAQQAHIDQARTLGKTLICSNPDRASPRADGATVQSPGALAHAYKDQGGAVIFYGKPHRPIFGATFAMIPANDPARVLMVGDSPEHDIAGAQAAGWDSLFIHGGLHAGQTEDLFEHIHPPTFSLPELR